MNGPAGFYTLTSLHILSLTQHIEYLYFRCKILLVHSSTPPSYLSPNQVVEEQVDENYDPTADFFRAAPPSMTPMYQPEYKAIDLGLNPVPIPTGAVPQGEAIDIETTPPPPVEAAATAAVVPEGGSDGGEGTSGAAAGTCNRIHNNNAF